ncbi:hypothetical protein ACIQWR_19250 [Streptomyces sp. NPDC098789]|uniref:hypothetical protein n=1 Tax=Streptomyces sp. NPDC098789 TaxID=3366098 RepID=UPI00380E1110
MNPDLAQRSHLEPTPVEGCDGCARLAWKREEARADRDWGRVAALNQAMENHKAGPSHSKLSMGL